VPVLLVVVAACGGSGAKGPGDGSGEDEADRIGQAGPPPSISPPGRRPGTLPPGVDLLPGNSSQVTDDIGPHAVELPSGQVVAEGELVGDLLPGRGRPLPYRLAPGAYPVHVTLARGAGSSADLVALATLVASDAPTVRWRHVKDFSVDAGAAGFTSNEGSDVVGRWLQRDAGRSEAFWLAASSALAAEQIAVVPIEGKLNAVQFWSGSGDGGYGLYAGLDGKGRPTRFVMDFQVLDLAWP
jgi:hypothetical protein